jgi:hypothetical protein
MALPDDSWSITALWQFLAFDPQSSLLATFVMCLTQSVSAAAKLWRLTEECRARKDHSSHRVAAPNVPIIDPVSAEEKP